MAPLPSSFSVQNIEYTSVWVSNALSPISAQAPSYTSPDGLLSASALRSVSVTFTAGEGYGSYEWYVDGKLQGESSNFFEISAKNYALGLHTVMLLADGKYSSSVQVELVDMWLEIKNMQSAYNIGDKFFYQDLWDKDRIEVKLYCSDGTARVLDNGYTGPDTTNENCEYQIKGFDTST